MATIFRIEGGIQKAVQCKNDKHMLTIIKEQSDLPEQEGVSGKFLYTNTAWSTDLQRLKAAIKEYTPLPKIVIVEQ